MHTTVTVQIADPLSEAALDAAFDDAFEVFSEIEVTANEWNKGSPLAELNAHAGEGWVTAAKTLCDVVRLSLDGAKKTNGRFDPTWAALKEVWRFGDNEPHRVPSADEVRSACSLVSFRDVDLRPAPAQSPPGSCQIRLRRAGMKLGLGGVVKGWGVDQAVARLRKRGIRNFFIQAGGDLYLAGTNGGRPWRAGIRDPRGPADKSFARLEVRDRAFSTSGDYEHFFIGGDTRYHHIIDPTTCWPATLSRSVTVLAKTATDAEFLTKAAFILGPKEGLALVEKLGAKAVIVGADNQVHASKSLQGKLEYLAPPTP